MAKLKWGTVLWSYLSLFHVSQNAVFRKRRSIVELCYFYSSLTTSFVLEILPNESQDALNPPLDFSIQPLDIFYASLGSPLNEQVEDEHVNYKLTLSLGPLLLLHLKIFHKTFHLVSQLK